MGGRDADELRQPLLEEDDSEAGPSTQPRDESASDSPLFRVCPYILANEFCERLAYYGLATNLVTFFIGARPWVQIAATTPAPTAWPLRVWRRRGG